MGFATQLVPRIMATSLKFRNIDASPDDPVETWPFEGILAALERGTLPDWRRIASVITNDPWGAVARQVEEAVAMGLPYGVGPFMESIIRSARDARAGPERDEVVHDILRLLTISGLSRTEFASAIGTSPSRLSPYLSGKGVPSAARMVRLRVLAQRREGSPIPR